MIVMTQCKVFLTVVLGEAPVVMMQLCTPKDVQDFPPFETLFETDVSEQRDMPRPPPARALDLEINEREGEIPQHRQTYRAVVHTSQGRKAEYKCI